MGTGGQPGDRDPCRARLEDRFGSDSMFLASGGREVMSGCGYVGGRFSSLGGIGSKLLAEITNGGFEVSS